MPLSLHISGTHIFLRLKSEYYVNYIIWPFSGSITEEEYGYFMQDGATAHTDNFAINVLNKVFDNTLVSHRLWPTKPLVFEIFICGET
jgi:hypothetical protein